MPWTIIVASSDAAQLEKLMDAAEAIKQAIGEPSSHRTLNAMSVEHVESLRGMGREPNPELLIVTAELQGRAPSTTPIAFPGFELVKRLQSRATPPPACILVSDRYEHLAAALEMQRCETLPVTTTMNYVASCLKLASKLKIFDHGPATPPIVPAPGSIAPESQEIVEAVATLAPAAITEAAITESERPYFALIDVSLRKRAAASMMQLIVNHADYPQLQDQVPLELRQAQVNNLIKDSRRFQLRLSKALCAPRSSFLNNWLDEYRSLGARIYKMLSQAGLSNVLGQAQVLSKGNVALRFNLEPTVYDGLWESIYDKDFMMLETAMVRRVMQPNRLGESRIDSNEGALRILAIRADVRDGSTPKGPDDRLWRKHSRKFDGELRALRHLRDEMTALKKLQTQSKSQSVGTAGEPHVQVHIVPGSTARRNSQAGAVKAWLKANPRSYDILHFSGHALFGSGGQAEDNRGYLVFSGSPQPEAIPIAEVASWLEETSVKLVYLSCCRSGAAQAAFEFARHQIPMAIGFSWDLDDHKAVPFAQNFYDALLGQQLRVCPAFREARRQLYNKHKEGDPIWASPVLFAQPIDWSYMEQSLRPIRERGNQPLEAPSPRQPLSQLIEPPVALTHSA